MDINTPYYSRTNCGMIYSAVLAVKFTNESPIEPVTLDDAKAWCAVDGNDFDGVLTTLIGAAREQCEAYVNLSIIARTVEAKVKAGTKLPYGTVDEDNIIAIYDEDLNETTGEYKDYRTGTYIVTYPVVPDPRHANKFKAAILNQVAYLYEHRGDETEAQLSPGAKAILKPLRVI